MLYEKKELYLQSKIKLGGIDMLGVNSPREPITPEFSREIRAALWRSMTGNLTAEEKAIRRRCRTAAKKWKIVWETK